MGGEEEEENKENEYGQNFRGVFCRCGREYDAKKERETMIQCLVCEVCILEKRVIYVVLMFATLQQGLVT